MDKPGYIRELVVTKNKEGLNQKTIANHLKISQSTVSRLLKLYRSTNNVLSPRKGRLVVKVPLLINDGRE